MAHPRRLLTAALWWWISASAPLVAGVAGHAAEFQAIAAGWAHACALSSTGGVQCWGFNDKGQLGTGAPSSVEPPVQVIGLSSGVASLAAGTYQTCALTTGGGVKCWGDPAHVGDPTAQVGVPVTPTGLSSGVVAITTSGSTPAPSCWGVACSAGETTSTGSSATEPRPTATFRSR